MRTATVSLAMALSFVAHVAHAVSIEGVAVSDVVVGYTWQAGADTFGDELRSSVRVDALGELDVNTLEIENLVGVFAGPFGSLSMTTPTFSVSASREIPAANPFDDPILITQTLDGFRMEADIMWIPEDEIFQTTTILDPNTLTGKAVETLISARVNWSLFLNDALLESRTVFTGESLVRGFWSCQGPSSNPACQLEVALSRLERTVGPTLDTVEFIKDQFSPDLRTEVRSPKFGVLLRPGSIVPEPARAYLLGIALAVVAFIRNRRGIIPESAELLEHH